MMMMVAITINITAMIVVNVMIRISLRLSSPGAAAPPRLLSPGQKHQSVRSAVRLQINNDKFSQYDVSDLIPNKRLGRIFLSHPVEGKEFLYIGSITGRLIISLDLRICTCCAGPILVIYHFLWRISYIYFLSVAL